MKPVCPKCRAQGLSTDCADRLLPKRQGTMDEQYELEVTFTFPTLGPIGAGTEANTTATDLRERWLEDPNLLVGALCDAVFDEDFSLRITPVFGS